MAVLLDTNILVRLANTADALYSLTDRALIKLRRRGETLHITAQNLVEFRAVATRPASANGIGMTAANAEWHTALFEATFPLLPETPAIFLAWQAVVGSLGVLGKQVHDARLVAVCHVHAVTHLLTFNVGHFARLAAAPPGVAVLDPATV